MTKSKILVVDDDDFLVETIRSILEPEYDISCSNTGEGIIDLLDSAPPDLIILDVKLPQLDGYEVCKIIKDSFDHDTIPVLFLSGSNDLENRIRGYEVGGEDYVTKPFDGQELRAKIQTLIRHRMTTEEYKEKANGAMQQAMSVITSTGETAYVIDFLRESYRCENLHALADQLVKVCMEYGLNTLVRFSPENNIIFKGSSGLGTPLEKSLFDHIPPHVHIHSFNNRCIFNYDITGILVKNMPMDDADKCGRIRDNVAIIAEGANAAVKSIIHAEALNEQKNHLRTLMEHSCKILELIEKKSHEQRVSSSEIMSHLTSDIEKRFMHLGLSEEQETELIDAIKNAEEKQGHLFKLGDMVEKHLTILISEFEEALKSDMHD